MKILLKRFPFLLLLFLVISCSLYVEGGFSVYSSIQLYKKKLFGGRKAVQIQPGRYESSVDFNGNSEKVKLEVELSPREKETFVFRTEDTTIPVDGTWVRVTSEDLEQDYDALISVLKTVEREYELRRDWENCQYEYCYTRCSGSGQDRHCWRECRNEWGRRLVEYYLVHTFWNTRFQLLSEQDELVAEFSGDKDEQDRDYVYQGRCR